MEILTLLGMVGSMIDDVFAIFSAGSSFILLLGSFAKTPFKRYGEIANWSITGLILGGLFQLAMAITGTTPDKIGLVFRMPALMVNALLGVSLLMLVGRWAIRKILRK